MALFAMDTDSSPLYRFATFASVDEGLYERNCSFCKEGPLQSPLHRERSIASIEGITSLEWQLLKITEFSQAKFPNEPDDSYIGPLGRLLYYRYINPAIVYVLCRMMRK